MQTGPLTKKPRGHGKYAVPRHRVLSAGGADRLERAIEKTFRQETKRAVVEELAAIQHELKDRLPEVTELVLARLKKTFPLMQRLHDLAEDAREAVWCSNDPSDASEALDELIELALKAGATPRDRNYPP